MKSSARWRPLIRLALRRGGLYRRGRSPPTDAQVWALVDWLPTKLPPSDPVSVALAAVKRNRGTVQASVTTQLVREDQVNQPTLFEENM